MRDHVAVVAGASGGIGRATAALLGQQGWTVVGVARDPDRLAAAMSGVSGADVLAADLTTAQGQRDVVQHCVRRHGRIDAVVHAAGAFDWGNAAQADPGAWDDVLDANVRAVTGLTASALPVLLESPSPAVVVIGSNAGDAAFRDNAAYVASKHAVHGFARALFLDVRERGCKVVLVSPGNVRAGASIGAPMARPEEMLEPGDVADAVLWALSTRAGACPTEIRLMPQRDPWTA